MANWTDISKTLNGPAVKTRRRVDTDPNMDTREIEERQARVGKDINRCPHTKLAFEGAGPRVRHYNNTGSDW